MKDVHSTFKLGSMPGIVRFRPYLTEHQRLTIRSANEIRKEMLRRYGKTHPTASIMLRASPDVFVIAYLLHYRSCWNDKHEFDSKFKEACDKANDLYRYRQGWSRHEGKWRKDFLFKSESRYITINHTEYNLTKGLNFSESVARLKWMDRQTFNIENRCADYFNVVRRVMTDQDNTKLHAAYRRKRKKPVPSKQTRNYIYRNLNKR